MKRTAAKSLLAAQAIELVEALQARLVSGLQAMAAGAAMPDRFDAIEWFRDQGRHGGGTRFATEEGLLLNRASANVSSVHYDDEPNRRLSSANALSAIIHPRHPRCPSYHMHISWTEMRDGAGYWRLMADLNPSIEDPQATERFDRALREVSGELYKDGRTQGDAYFYIPVLERHRGVCHFYLEGYNSGDFAADRALAQAFGETVIDTYLAILADAVSAGAEVTATERKQQLDYHTLYLLQVLTLDRGTTSGLLIHDQNDVGILASIPSYVDRALLQSWCSRMVPPQDTLLANIVDTLDDKHPSPVDEQVRERLAEVVRVHYRAHPNALELQASGGIIPPTVDNHLKAKN